MSGLPYENFPTIAYCRFSLIISVLTLDFFQVIIGSPCNIIIGFGGTHRFWWYTWYWWEFRFENISILIFSGMALPVVVTTILSEVSARFSVLGLGF